MNEEMYTRLSIGIVAYNEEKFLRNLLEDLKNQKYPHGLMEIILIDSMSEDKTRQIMKEFQKENTDFYSVQVLENPKKIQAAGWNVAIKNFTGDVLARIDAHTRISSEYSEQVMKNIHEGEYVVGGIRPCISEKDEHWLNVLLQVETSLFGSSINSSRRSHKKQYVKTMFHAAYRREVFDKVGVFNESLLRTEDNEMHYRIRKAGYKLCYDPEIISYQYARNNFSKMVKQKYSNGKWIGITLKECPKCISFYHLIPCVFVLGIVLTLIMIKLGAKEISIMLWIIYAIFAVVNTIISGLKNRFYMRSILMPAMFLILHVAYGIGTFVGLLKRGAI